MTFQQSAFVLNIHDLLSKNESKVAISGFEVLVLLGKSRNELKSYGQRFKFVIGILWIAEVHVGKLSEGILTLKGYPRKFISAW